MPTIGTTTCLVCGYGQMEPLELGTICPSCGTQYGVSDEETTYPELRQRWIDQGMKWWSRYTPEPLYWSPLIQLRSIGYEAAQGDLHLPMKGNMARAEKPKPYGRN